MDVELPGIPYLLIELSRVWKTGSHIFKLRSDITHLRTSRYSVTGETITAGRFESNRLAAERGCIVGASYAGCK